MIIKLASVGRTPKSVAAKFTADEIDLDEVKVIDELALDGSVYEDDRGIHLSGKVSGELQHECSRCLEQVQRSIEFEFEDVFVAASAVEPVDDAEIKDNELLESVISDDAIDLAEVIREQVLLELPEQVFCKEDCKGLCPKCGADRNLIDCNCENDEIDPRWAALKNLN